VAAAIEGTLLGIPSIAVSLVTSNIINGHNRKKLNFKVAAKFAEELAMKVLRQGLPDDTLLNVNVPNSEKIKGVKFTKQGKRIYDNAIQEHSDPRGRKCYWIGGGAPQWEAGVNTDFDAINKGYISVTPVHLDLTNYKALEYIKKKWKV